MTVWQFSVTMVVLTNTEYSAQFWYSVSLALGSSFGFFYAMFVRELLGIRGNDWAVWLGYAIAVIIAVYILSGGAYVIDGVYQSPHNRHVVARTWPRDISDEPVPVRPHGVWDVPPRQTIQDDIILPHAKPYQVSFDRCFACFCGFIYQLQRHSQSLSYRYHSECPECSP